jgi:hypothetical protein
MAARQQLEGIDFRLNHLGIITGRVFDAVTGESIRGLVTFTSADLRPSTAIASLHGQFRLGLQPGRYFGIATSFGYATTRYGETHPCEVPCNGNGGTAVSLEYDRSVAADFRLQPACEKTIAPTGVTMPAAGGSGTFVVNAPTTCIWAPFIDTGVDFVRVQRVGTSEVRYEVEPNLRESERTVTILLPGAAFRITQEQWRRRAVR